MILNGILSFIIAVSFAVSTPTDITEDTYDHFVNFRSTGLVDPYESLICTSSTNVDYVMVPQARMNGNIYFNDFPAEHSINGWMVSNLTIYLGVNCYKIENNDLTYVDSVALTLDSSVTNFTGFSYANESPVWSDWYLRFGINIANHTLYMQLYDSDDSIITSVSRNINDTFSLGGYSYSTYTFDYSYYRSQVDEFVNGYYDTIREGMDIGGADYSKGYLDGYHDGQDNQMNPEMFTIFNGILNVATIPINVLLGIFNFEVFGINISSLVSALLSICVLVIVIRLVVGSSSKGD